MATRKPTTKAKTKTSNAKSRSNAAKSKAVKTTKVSTRAVVAKQARSAQNVNLLSLRRILIIASGLYAVLAVAAVALMNHVTYELTVGYLAKDELASKTSTVLAPAIHVLYDVEVRWVLVAILVLSLVLPILYLTRLERRYANALKGRVLPWRWIDLAVTGALITETVALLNGAQDIMVLKLIGGLIAITCALGWIAERQNENAPKPVWSAYLTSVASGILPWLLIIVYMAATPFHGLVRCPWYVYAASGAVLMGFILLAWNQLNQHRCYKAWKDYLVVERNYLLINTATKVTFAAILIAGLRK